MYDVCNCHFSLSQTLCLFWIVIVTIGPGCFFFLPFFPFFFIIQWAAKKLPGSRSLSIPFRSMYVHLVVRWSLYFSAMCPFTICVRSPWLS